MGLLVGATLAFIPLHLASSSLGHINTNKSHLIPTKESNRIEISQESATACDDAKAFVYKTRREIAQLKDVTLPEMVARDKLLTKNKDQAFRNIQLANTRLQNLTNKFQQLQVESPPNNQLLNQLQSEINYAQSQVNIQSQEYIRAFAELQASKDSILALGLEVVQLLQVTPSYNSRLGSSCGYVQNTTTNLANHPSSSSTKSRESYYR